MQGHNSYIQSTYEKKLCQVSIFLKKYMQKNSLNFQLIKKIFQIYLMNLKKVKILMKK